MACADDKTGEPGAKALPMLPRVTSLAARLRVTATELVHVGKESSPLADQALQGHT